MRYLYVLIFACLLVIPGSWGHHLWQQSKIQSVQERIQRYNEGLPRMLDEVVRADKVQVDSVRQISLYFSLVHVEKGQVNVQYLEKTFLHWARNNLDTELKTLLREEGLYAFFHIRDKRSSKILDFRLEPGDFQGRQS